jgi:hypothetical protein
MNNYVSERKRIPWRGMIALFRTERYKMPIEGIMKNYDYFRYTQRCKVLTEGTMKR